MNIVRLLFLASFLFTWLSTASFMATNISFSPPLALSTQLYGPYVWRVEGHDVVRAGYMPQLRIYGRITSAKDVPQIVVLPDFFEWIGTFGGKGAIVQPGAVFATQLPQRPFVTQWDIEHDAGLRLHAGRARFNAQFIFWAGMTFFLPVVFMLWLTDGYEPVLSPRERWRRDEAFRDKAREIEIDFKGKPNALRRRAVLLAFCGYAVLLAIVLFLITLGLGLGFVTGVLTRIWFVAIYIAISPMFLAYCMARTLLSPPHRDVGMSMTRERAPKLFAMLDMISTKAQGKPFARVFIISEMNAMVSRATGKLGFFGFGPVTLSIGFPLMLALTPEELQAVIGHEYGHIAAKDNALGQWVYRIRNTWLSMDENLKADTLWRILRLNRLCNLFLKFFKPYSFVLSRQCEYEADAFAARMTSNRHIAQALVEMDVNGRRLTRDFWPPIWESMRTTPTPDKAMPYKKMTSFLANVTANNDDRRYIETAETGYDSTHPCTRDRVAALGEELDLPTAALKINSVSAFLPLQPLEIARLFDLSWINVYKKEWRAAFDTQQKMRATFDELSMRAMAQLTRKDLDDLLLAAQATDKYEKALEVCEEILRREPDNISAKVHILGIRLVYMHDASALFKLDELVQDHPAFVPEASRYAVRYLTAQGRLKEAEVYSFRLREWDYQKQAANEERAELSPYDIFVSHGVDPQYVRRIVSYFKQHKDTVGEVYLARKMVAYLPEKPEIIVGIVPRGMVSLKGRKHAYERINAILPGLSLDPAFHVFILDGGRPFIQRRLKRTQGARIM